MANLFSKAPIEMPNKSGFDMSHENFFTAKVGTLTPCLVDYLLPNDTVSVGFNAQIQLPPMATDFYGEVVGKYELFFVPYRILFGGWKDAIAPVDSSDSDKAFYYLLPTIDMAGVAGAIPSDFPGLGAGSLADFLGFKAINVVYGSSLTHSSFNAFPFLAYHKIYDDWYRDSRLTKPCFTPSPYNDEYEEYNTLSNLPYIKNWTSSGNCIGFGIYQKFGNGHFLLGLWQRNWPKDYFTNSTVKPQAGDPASLKFSVDGSEGSFTIAGLRAANSLQMFMERNNMAGNRYQDRIKAHFDIYPSDAVIDKALYLGSGVVNVYCKSVFQQGSAVDSQNPFSTVGSKYGSSQGVGGGSLCKKFTATEHGVLMCIFSLVPRRYYSSGIRRQLHLIDIRDYPFPTLAGVGDQEIYQWELSGYVSDNSFNNIFGYSQRFSEFKFMSNEVHGLLRDGNSLSAFCLQSSYDGYENYLSSDFIEIPTDYMDQVSAVDGDVSKFGCWNDTYFSYKKVSTLPAYSIPTLENLKHSHVEGINLGGTRL